jgi:hypothetical protein
VHIGFGGASFGSRPARERTVSFVKGTPRVKRPTIERIVPVGSIRRNVTAPPPEPPVSEYEVVPLLFTAMLLGGRAESGEDLLEFGVAEPEEI